MISVLLREVHLDCRYEKLYNIEEKIFVTVPCHWHLFKAGLSCLKLKNSDLCGLSFYRSIFLLLKLMILFSAEPNF